MANIPGTNVASTIAPFTTDDQFPTHDAIYGKGGQREVATIAERDAIPLARLTEGCTCYVAATEKTYRWKSNAWVDDTPAIATDASDIDYTPSGSSTPTNVAAALDSLNESVNNLDIPSDASDIDYTPSGSSTQTTVASALDSINESVSGLEDSVQGNADDIANLQEGAVAVDVNTTTKVFAIKNAKGQNVGTITVSETTGLPATLTLAKAGTNGQNITISLPTLAYNSQTQMLEYVDVTGTHVPTIKLSNLQIKTVFDYNTYEGDAPTSVATNTYAIGDLALIEKQDTSTTPATVSYELAVVKNVTPGTPNDTIQWQPLGSINNVSLVADQVAFDNSTNGFEATDVQGAIEEVKSLIGNASIKDIYPDLYPSVLYVVDGNGYIGLKLDVNGLDIASISTHLASLIQDIAGSGGEDSGGGDVTPSDGSTWLTGKRFVAIGASTCRLQTGVSSWQEELASRTGGIFYRTIQNDLATAGARCISFINNDSSDQVRLKLLKERITNGQANNVDVIFFLNGNNSSFTDNWGSINNTPFFQTQIVSSEIYASSDDADNAFGKSAQIPGIGGNVFPNVDEDSRIGTVGRLRYYTNSGTVSSKQVCFLSRDKNDWGDYTKWGSPTLCACLMGMLEYAMNEFPTTKLFMLAAPRFTESAIEKTTASLLRADGTFDVYKWRNAQKSNGGNSHYFDCLNTMKAACSLYNVPFVDLQAEAGISVYNVTSFHPTSGSGSGAHPTSAGYVRWGQTLARLLTGK